MVHYSETMPQEQNFDTTQMNKQGRVIRQLEKAPLDRQVASEKTDRERQQKQQSAEQKRRDDALIKTYTDVLEIDAARERNIALPFQAIEGLKVQREKVMESLNVLASQADAYDKQSKPRPPGLTEDIQDKRRQMTRIAGDIKRYEGQVTLIRNKYDEDKRRFIEIKGEAAPLPSKS